MSINTMNNHKPRHHSIHVCKQELENIQARLGDFALVSVQERKKKKSTCGALKAINCEAVSTILPSENN